MAKRHEEAESNDREARAVGRLLRSFLSTDSYGLVLVMIVVTYVMAAALSSDGERRSSCSSRSARCGWRCAPLRRRGLLVVANVLFAVAAAGAVINLFTDAESGLSGFVFVAASLLYVVAPVAIVRHVAYRPGVDQETMLGALAAYLLIGMAFAFAYRSVGAIETAPSSAPTARAR